MIWDNIIMFSAVFSFWMFIFIVLLSMLILALFICMLHVQPELSELSAGAMVTSGEIT